MASETKNNHYIPQFYLDKWTFNNKQQVYCLRKETGKIFTPNIRNICSDRIWSEPVEKEFSKRENLWKNLLDKIITDKKIDHLTEEELKLFISFTTALNIRRKHFVDAMYAAVNEGSEIIEQEYLKQGKATIEDIKWAKQFDKPINDYYFSKSCDVDFLFDSNPKSNFHHLKYLNYGLKQISATRELEFLTSNAPFLLLSNEEKNRCRIFILPLTPTLCVFAVPIIKDFIKIYNYPIENFVKLINADIVNNADFIISRKRNVLETFLNHKKIV